MTRPSTGRGRRRYWIPALAALVLGACKENLSVPTTGTIGPDTSGPRITLRPGRDTTVDSTGVLLVSVTARDRSGVRQVELLLVPPTFGFPPLTPFDTVFGAAYQLQLGNFKHSTFRYYVHAIDILDHETTTDTVVVTVR